jgi:hypothetical protein
MLHADSIDACFMALSLAMSLAIDGRYAVILSI